MELEAFKEVQKRRSEGSKPHSTPATLKWLDENYELAQGVCIPRSSLYLHYLDFCEKSDTVPVNAASFGKIIRQQFSQLTTRRLGTRGQSKYHYYGIAIRESSEYYEAVYSKSGVTGIGNESIKKDTGKQNIAYSPRSKLGTLLPEFPDIKDVTLPPNVPEAKVSTFIMMYRTHCQRILDTVIRANFDEVQNYLLHFWQGMPSHIIPILDANAVVNIVGVCDSILYKAIASVLMPSVLQALPESLTQVIRKFAYELDDWLKFALNNLPNNLRLIKFQVSKGFTELLKLQTSLNHLCQASKTVINSSDIVSQMLEDWELVDFPDILRQTMYTLGDQTSDKTVQLINDFYQEFGCLLDDHASIETYTDWLDSIINRCIILPSRNNNDQLQSLARYFLLNWSSVSTRIIRDLTLHSAPSFGSYHLIHLMFDDYVSYTIGMSLAESRADIMKESLKRQSFTEKQAKTDDNSYGISYQSGHLSTHAFKNKILLDELDINPPNHAINHEAPFNKLRTADSPYNCNFYASYGNPVDDGLESSVRHMYRQDFPDLSQRKKERKRKNLQSMRNDSTKDNTFQMHERNTVTNNMPLFSNNYSGNVKRFRQADFSNILSNHDSNLSMHEHEKTLKSTSFFGQFAYPSS